MAATARPVLNIFFNPFDWGRSRRNKPEQKPELKYHDVDLPFPSSLLSKTFLEGRELRCCYKATEDGFSAAAFHQCCDFRGPCVVVGYTTESFKFGGFNPEGYRSTDDYYDTFKAFLFYWPEKEPSGAPVVLPKVGGSGAALFDYARGGPQFGADGLLIGAASSGVGDLRKAKSRLGLSYAKRPDGKASIFGEDSKAELAQVHVFCCPRIAALY